MPSDSDDAFSVAAPGSVIRKLGSDTVAVGAPAGLRFVVSGIQPYMGMAGHAVVVRDDGSVFIHLHPMGTISTAAQMVLARGQPMSMGALSDTVSFPYAFPKAGRYYVWVQVKRGGRILTAPYVVVAQ